MEDCPTMDMPPVAHVMRAHPLHTCRALHGCACPPTPRPPPRSSTCCTALCSEATTDMLGPLGLEGWGREGGGISSSAESRMVERLEYWVQSTPLYAPATGQAGTDGASPFLGLGVSCRRLDLAGRLAGRLKVDTGRQAAVDEDACRSSGARAAASTCCTCSTSCAPKPPPTCWTGSRALRAWGGKGL